MSGLREQLVLNVTKGPRLPALEPRTDRPSTIGRVPSCDIFLDARNVSRLHAKVHPAPLGWAITDEGSRNGVKVNGVRIEAHRMTPILEGDAIEIGPWTFEAGRKREPGSTGTDTGSP